jgi:hypothetical protein
VGAGCIENWKNKLSFVDKKNKYDSPYKFHVGTKRKQTTSRGAAGTPRKYCAAYFFFPTGFTPFLACEQARTSFGLD